MYYPSEVKFNQSTKNSHIVQLWREIPVGSETPVSAFLKLGGKEPSCLLESIEGEKKIARYSFIVLEPYLLFQSKDESVLIKRGNKNNNFKTTDPLNYLKKLLTENQLIHDISLPRLSGGAIGYIAYDYIKRIEKIYSRKKPGLSLPELYFIFPKIIISFDHLRQKIKIIRIVNPKEKIKYKDACREIEKYIKKLSAPILIEPVRSKSGIIKSNTSKHKFINAVKKAKKYIIDGDGIAKKSGFSIVNGKDVIDNNISVDALIGKIKGVK